MLVSKKELSQLPIYQLTCQQFAWVYPERLAQEHASAVKDAWQKGKEVYDKAEEEFPCLKNIERRKKK